MFQTPLHVCSEHGFVANVMLLVAHKGNLVAQDNTGLTPLDIAEKGEHVECMQVLKQAAGKNSFMHFLAVVSITGFEFSYNTLIYYKQKL